MFNKRTFQIMQKAANYKGSREDNNSKKDSQIEGMKGALRDCKKVYNY